MSGFESPAGNRRKDRNGPLRLLLRNQRCPGDVLMMTAALRDLHRAYPGRYLTAVDTPCNQLFQNNPLVVTQKQLGAPDKVITCDCPGVNLADERPFHFMQACVEDLENQLGLRIPVGRFCGEVYLSARELRLPSPVAEAGHAGPYWIVMAGGKYDFTTKWWDPEWYQAVVDHFAGRIHFVQCGEQSHWHPPLRNVTNLVGATDIRQFIRVMYHADGVLCPVTFAMHLAAAVPANPRGPAKRPCVVIAGGRESPHWEMYPNHQFLHTVGALECCASGGCWRSLCQPVGNGSPNDANACLRPVTVRDRLRIGKCMTLITPQKVISAIETYYHGGVLKYSAGADDARPEPSRPSGNRTHRRGVAVTIGVGRHERLARLAAREVHERTGLETIILRSKDFEATGLEQPHFLKFRLFDLIDAENILFFDADLVCLENWDPSVLFDRPEIVAVRERQNELVMRESSEWGVPADEYLNTGMLIINRQHHRSWLGQAELLKSRHYTCLHEQSPLNAARVQLGMPVKFLDRRYNWMGFGASSLSHQMPVVMAHKLVPQREDINIRYFKGDYALAPPSIAVDESETPRLYGKTLKYLRAGQPSWVLRLRDDGTIAPQAGSGGPGYWFVHSAHGRPTLALTSEVRVVGEFVQTLDGLWTSIAPGDNTRCVDESVSREVKITRRNARSVADRFIRSVPPWDPGRYHGRGIVMCSGPRHITCAWVCIRMLRHLGCQLPIELWHLNASELALPMRKALEPYSVRCVDASEVRQQHPVRLLNGWELKPYSILHSGFEEVLLLDADNVPIRDPDFLFESDPYRRHGAVFWPDFGRLAADRPIWKICGIRYRDEPEFESGQIVVDKQRCWKALQLTMHLNEHSDFYYDYIHGDKETFHMAWRILRQKYYMVPWPIYPLQATMCQHDFDGRRLFQHRNLTKWVLHGENPHISGFEFEDVCLEFIADLARQLNGVMPAAAMAGRH